MQSDFAAFVFIVFHHQLDVCSCFDEYSCLWTHKSMVEKGKYWYNEFLLLHLMSIERMICRGLTFGCMLEGKNNAILDKALLIHWKYKKIVQSANSFPCTPLSWSGNFCTPILALRLRPRNNSTCTLKVTPNYIELHSMYASQRNNYQFYMTVCYIENH